MVSQWDTEYETISTPPQKLGRNAWDRSSILPVLDIVHVLKLYTLVIQRDDQIESNHEIVEHFVLLSH